jgi:hypothetical protein
MSALTSRTWIVGTILVSWERTVDGERTTATLLHICLP